MERVAITGIGAVTTVAGNFSDSWENIKNRISGIGRVTKFDVSDLPWKMSGEVKGFDPALYLSDKESLRLDPFIHYAVAAAVMAAHDAGLTPAHPSLSCGGVIIGSSRGGITTMEKEFKKLNSGKRISPYLMPATTISMAASYVAQKLGAKGNCLGISNACASGANAIGEAFRLIRYGLADIMLAGGTEAPICRLCINGYGSSGALSKTDDCSASRPFDRTRDGFVIAEGASVLVLEKYESALKREVPIYAEIIGYGNNTDAFHVTRPDAEGEARAMLKALEDADISSEDVDYINAHATSTLIGDRTEADAIRAVFKNKASKIPVSALKSMTGHMLAASGAFEAACTAMSLKEGVIPPTINISKKDPECDINIVTEKRNADIRIAITNSFGFGGVNAVIVLKSI